MKISESCKNYVYENDGYETIQLVAQEYRVLIEIYSGRQTHIGISGGELIEDVADRIERDGNRRSDEEQRELWRGLLGKKACQPLVTSSSLS